jgi:superfamily II DNA or RNA helicase
MKIETVIKVNVNALTSNEAPEHINVTYNNDENLIALSWLFDTKDNGLYQKVKRHDGIWDRDISRWTFPDSTVAQNFLDEIVKKHPDWPVIGDPSFLPLAGIKFSRILVNDGFEALIVPFPMPYFSCISKNLQTFLVATGGTNSKNACLLIGNAVDIAEEVDSFEKQGAICNSSLAKKWTFTTGGCKLQVKVTGWAVQIQCDLSNPLHYQAAPVQKYRWEGFYPNGIKVAIPWNGTIHTTRKLWTDIKNKLQSAGLEWEGDDPEAELAIPASFDASRVAGWNMPTPNGYLLHAYQKEGAQFCASRGMRAMICDEMGVGKTAQAIAAAEAVDAPRILIICPANARYVWEREIQEWGGRGAIQHITSQLDKMDMNCRWHIVTYDLISVRVETWRLNNEQEKKAFVDAFPNLSREIQKNQGGGYPHKISLDKPQDKVPDFADPKRVEAWNKTMQRLRGELLEQFLSAGKMLTIMDEAHRAKNKSSKRTKAIQCIAAGETQLLMLTGTPLRNNEHEAAVLLGLLDAEASTALTKERGYTIQDIKDYLSHFMIRRTKAEVLPELPEKTRQRIDISNLDSEQMQVYLTSLALARENYYYALKTGASELSVRQSMQGGIEQARKALGIAKVRGGEVVDLVLEVIENKECCVVFCAHHQVSDELRAQLEKQNLRVAVVDGRTPQKTRAKVVEDFQGGKLDVFIGGINAAGEAITLTRSDTVIFIELDWVPAAMLQAEDRIHRVGQQSNCQIIQLVARIPELVNLDEMMVDLIGSKVARIGTVLDEDTTNIISGSIQAKMYKHLLTGFDQEVAGALFL